VKQNWVRKEDVSVLKRMGPKKIWVPKTNNQSILQAQVGGNNAANRPEDCSGTRSGNNQFWFVDSGCSRHMTGEKFNFLSFAAT